MSHTRAKLSAAQVINQFIQSSPQQVPWNYTARLDRRHGTRTIKHPWFADLKDRNHGNHYLGVCLKFLQAIHLWINLLHTFWPWSFWKGTTLYRSSRGGNIIPKRGSAQVSSLGSKSGDQEHALALAVDDRPTNQEGTMSWQVTFVYQAPWLSFVSIMMSS